MSNLGWFECADIRGVPDIWTPSRITTDLWLDAADIGTFTLDSGAISQWRDKSGNDKHASASGSIRPIYAAAGFNSRPTVVFDAVDDRLDLVYIAQQLGQRIFAVVDTTNLQNTNSRVLLNRASVSAPYAPAIYIRNSNYGGCMPSVYWGTNWGAVYNTSLQRKYILGVEILSGLINIYVDGVKVVSTATGQTVVTSWIEISTVTTYGQQAAFNLSELIILPPSSTDADVLSVHGYLAHKWAMVTLLPSSHLYKSIPPRLDKQLTIHNAMNIGAAYGEYGINPFTR